MDEAIIRRTLSLHSNVVASVGRILLQLQLMYPLCVKCVVVIVFKSGTHLMIPHAIQSHSSWNGWKRRNTKATHWLLTTSRGESIREKVEMRREKLDRWIDKRLLIIVTMDTLPSNKYFVYPMISRIQHTRMSLSLLVERSCQQRLEELELLTLTTSFLVLCLTSLDNSIWGSARKVSCNTFVLTSTVY